MKIFEPPMMPSRQSIGFWLGGFLAEAYLGLLDI
jgi:hypothetical protein